MTIIRLQNDINVGGFPYYHLNVNQSCHSRQHSPFHWYLRHIEAMARVQAIPSAESEVHDLDTSSSFSDSKRLRVGRTESQVCTVLVTTSLSGPKASTFRLEEGKDKIHRFI